IGARRGVVDWRSVLDATSRNYEGRIDCRVELRARFGEVLDEDNVGAIEEQLTNSAASQRSPEFAWQQIGHRAAGAQQIPGALNEERSEVDLRGESASSARTFSAGFPGGASIDSELLTQALT